jgi:hypothetical protein
VLDAWDKEMHARSVAALEKRQRKTARADA